MSNEDKEDREDRESIEASDRRLRFERYHRGTIHVDHKPRPEDAKWYGHAPRPVPETDKNFRPRSIEF